MKAQDVEWLTCVEEAPLSPPRRHRWHRERRGKARNGKSFIQWRKCGLPMIFKRWITFPQLQAAGKRKGRVFPRFPILSLPWMKNVPKDWKFAVLISFCLTGAKMLMTVHSGWKIVTKLERSRPDSRQNCYAWQSSRVRIWNWKKGNSYFRTLLFNSLWHILVALKIQKLS